MSQDCSFLECSISLAHFLASKVGGMTEVQIIDFDDALVAADVTGVMGQFLNIDKSLVVNANVPFFTKYLSVRIWFPISKGFILKMWWVSSSEATCTCSCPLYTFFFGVDFSPMNEAITLAILPPRLKTDSIFLMSFGVN